MISFSNFRNSPHNAEQALPMVANKLVFFWKWHECKFKTWECSNLRTPHKKHETSGSFYSHSNTTLTVPSDIRHALRTNQIFFISSTTPCCLCRTMMAHWTVVSRAKKWHRELADGSCSPIHMCSFELHWVASSRHHFFALEMTVQCTIIVPHKQHGVVEEIKKFGWFSTHNGCHLEQLALRLNESKMTRMFRAFCMGCAN